MCKLSKSLMAKYFDALRKQENREVVRLTREMREHKVNCPMCLGLVGTPSVPLVDQLFGTRVKVGE